MGVPRHKEQILVELEESVDSIGILIGMVTRVTKDTIKELIVGPSGDINFTNSCFSTLKREMVLVTQYETTYEVSLEQLIFR
jgi:hypothetical protein